jgi:hypothetical protein
MTFDDLPPHMGVKSELYNMVVVNDRHGKSIILVKNVPGATRLLRMEEMKDYYPYEITLPLDVFYTKDGIMRPAIAAFIARYPREEVFPAVHRVYFKDKAVAASYKLLFWP